MLSEKYLKAKEDYSKAFVVLNEMSEEELKDAFSKLFVEYPLLERFSWTQYAPYFNDGDACYFSVNYYDISVNNNEDEDEEDEEEEEKVVQSDEPTILSFAEISQVEDKVKEILKQFDEDILESLFGSDNKVTVTKNGITSEDYESHS